MQSRSDAETKKHMNLDHSADVSTSRQLAKDSTASKADVWV